MKHESQDRLAPPGTRYMQWPELEPYLGPASVHELRTITPMPDHITKFVAIDGGFANLPSGRADAEG